MKKHILFILGFVAVAGFTVSGRASAQMKIGYVDTDRILQEYKPFVDAQSEFKRFADEQSRMMSEKENVIKKLQDDYERQKLLLSETKKQELEKDIQARMSEYQKFYEETNGKAQQKNQELSEPIYKDVNVVLERVAKTGGYDFVFNANQVAYAKEEHDITQKVLDDLNKDLEAKKKGSPAATKAGASGR